jgi:hypothetical protein
MCSLSATCAITLCLVFVQIQGFSVLADELELRYLGKSLDQIDQRFPMDLAGVIKQTEITEFPMTGQPSLEKTSGLASLDLINDQDRVTGFPLLPGSQYRFLVSMKELHRIDRITISGQLTGGTFDLLTADQPLSPLDKGWSSMIESQPLGVPATAYTFRPKSTLNCCVVIKTPAELPPSGRLLLSDISFYSTQDTREFTLERTTPEPKNQVIITGSTHSPGALAQVDSNPFDLCSMYAGARVSYVSSVVDPEHINEMNDDNAATFLEFDPKEKESVAVFDLGQNRRLTKLSLIHSTHPGDVKFYMVKDLPWSSVVTAVTKTAWLNLQPLFPELFTASDVSISQPFAALKETSPQIVTVDSSWFQTLRELGTLRTDDTMFSQCEAPISGGRYLIVRFLNRGTGSETGFRIFDINVFGDYPKDTFVVKPILLPEIEGEALITPILNPSISSDSSDSSTAGKIVIPTPSPTPPPAS